MFKLMDKKIITILRYFFVLNWPYVVAYTQMPLINTHADISSNARDQNVGLRLHLHPYFVYASGECLGKSAHN